MDKALGEPGAMVELDFSDENFFARKDKKQERISLEGNKFGFVDPAQRARNKQPDCLEDQRTVTLESKNEAATTDPRELIATQKLNATEQLDQCLKLLRSTNDTKSLEYFDRVDDTFGRIESSLDHNPTTSSFPDPEYCFKRAFEETIVH